MNLRSAVVLVIAALSVSACADNKKRVEFYVLASAAKAEQFTQVLAGISKRHGLRPNLGRLDEARYHLRVVDANGRWVNLWGANMPMSGKEDASLCGIYDEPHPDPGQYFVRITPILPFGKRSTALKLAADIKTELASEGYRVLQEPVTCSPLSKAQSPQH